MGVEPHCVRVVTGAIHKVFSVWIDIIEGESRFAYVARMVLILVVLACSGSLVLATKMTSRDLHVLFWLGQLPLLALATTSLSICLSFLFFVYIRVIREARAKQSRANRDTSRLFTGKKLAEDWVQAHCGLSRCHIRVCLLALVLLGAVSCYLGFAVGAFGANVTRRMAAGCSLGGTTARLEDTRQQLQSFHEKCLGSTGGLKTPVDMCDGFEAAFSPPAPYVMYLKNTETKMECTGFCEPQMPLFAGKDGKMVFYPVPCAAQVAKHILLVSSLVCYPCTIIGALIATLCLWFCTWDDI